MKKILSASAALALGALVVSGCWGPAQNEAPRATTGEATLYLVPSLGDGDGAADREVLAAVSNLTASDVFHLTMELSDASGVVASVDATGPAAGGPDLNGKPISFDHLKHNTTYTATWKAYKAAGVSPGDEIQVPPNTLSIPIGTNDTYGPISISVQLADTSFDGTASGGVAIVPGAIQDSASSESITF